MSSVLQKESEVQEKEWWQYLRSQSQDRQRDELLRDLRSVDKKVRYFEQLIEEKIAKFEEEKAVKIEEYEGYLKYL